LRLAGRLTDDHDRDTAAARSALGAVHALHVHSQKDHNDVDIYVCVEQGKASGLAIIASEPRQFTIVNIVGSIDLQKLHTLEGSFGIPKVSLEDKK
jgi:hypothetical protein